MAFELVVQGYDPDAVLYECAQRAIPGLVITSGECADLGHIHAQIWNHDDDQDAVRELLFQWHEQAPNMIVLAAEFDPDEAW